jgi:hypothetical protein
MFAGHIGAALVIGRVERRVNVGIFITAALLLDFLLWLLVLIGWETVAIPSNFANTHQPDFVFPYSHSLVASLAWSVIAGAVGFAGCARLRKARWRAASLIGTAVLSHWLLDALVHRPELPVAGVGSVLVGLGYWRNMPAALAIESTIVITGLLLCVPNSQLPRGRLAALAVMVTLLLVFTIIGMTIAPPPTSAIAMANSSLAALILVCALAGWLGRLPRAA